MHTLPRPLKDEATSSRLSSSLIQVLSPISFELDEHDGRAVASEDRWQLYNTEQNPLFKSQTQDLLSQHRLSLLIYSFETRECIYLSCLADFLIFCCLSVCLAVKSTAGT